MKHKPRFTVAVILGVLLVLAYFMQATSQEDCETARRLVDEAGRLYLEESDTSKRNAEQAIAKYEEAIRLCPSYTVPHYNLALVLELTGKLDAAQSRWQAYQEAAQGKQEEVFFLQQATLHLELIQHLKTGNQHLAAAQEALKTEKPQEALDSLEKAVTDHTKVVTLYSNSNFYYNLGLSYDLQGVALSLLGQQEKADASLREAVRNYQTALDKNPNHTSACFRLALALTVLGEYEGAYLQWKKFTLQSPEDEQRLSLAREMEQKLEQMMADTRSLLEDEMAGLLNLYDRADALKRDFEAIYERIESSGQTAEQVKALSATMLDFLLILQSGITAGTKGVNVARHLGVTGTGMLDNIARGFAGYAFGVTAAGQSLGMNIVLKGVQFDPTKTAIHGWELLFDAAGIPLGSVRTQKDLDEIKNHIDVLTRYQSLLTYMIIDRSLAQARIDLVTAISRVIGMVEELVNLGENLEQFPFLIGPPFFILPWYCISNHLEVAFSDR